jgi:hypothetical protein
MFAVFFRTTRGGRLVLLLLWVWAAGAVAATAQGALLLQMVDPDGSIRSLSLSAEDVDALPQVNLTTENEFVDGPTEFVGPLARDVLALLDKPGAESAVLTAANDYAIEIPLSDFEQYDVIFATAMDGNRLSLRDKGPIWVIYPMSQNAELRDAVYNDRLIWQLVRVEVK